VIFGFSLFRMVVVDFMHEVELNVWKAIFIHLLRILDCNNEALKHELDRRYALFQCSDIKVITPSLDFKRYPLLGWMGSEKYG
jgi:hypothetical protein